MRDIVIGLVLLGLAGVYWIEANAIPVTSFGGAVDAQTLPKLLAVALAFCSAVLALQGFLARRAGNVDPAAPEPVSGTHEFASAQE